MIVASDDGLLHLSIYDSFIIGSFSLPADILAGGRCKVIEHACHSKYSTHALLLETDQAVHLLPMDLRFVATSSGYLSLLASKSTSLQNLLRYIHQVQLLMAAEFKSTQDLPSRFLANVGETLSGQGQMNIKEAMYHSVATGHTLPVVREWLVDELAERVCAPADVQTITLTISVGSQALGQISHDWA